MQGPTEWDSEAGGFLKMDDNIVRLFEAYNK